MADADEDFGKQLAEAFEADLDQHAEVMTGEPAPAAEKEANEATSPVEASKVEESKKDEPVVSEEKKDEPVTPPADTKKPEEEDPAKPKDPESPVAPEEPVAPQPLTKEDVAEVITKMRNDELLSTNDLKQATDDVMEAYYPEGLSNTLVDQRTGKELKTPQDVIDVVEATGGEMSAEEAQKWLLNEQYKLDKSIETIRNDAQKIAETTITFKTNSISALQKYEPLFKAYPHLQAKVFGKMMKYVKSDEKKNVILSAPDPLDFYDDYLEPYQQAYEVATQQSATNPVESPTPAPVVPTPSAADRMDEGGDGGISEVDDPNNFAQQVNKEMARGL